MQRLQLSIVHSVIQSVSKSVNSLADGSFELSSKRNSLSPWCINSACALFPTAALLQSKEAGRPSIQIFSFVPKFSRHVRVRYVCVCVWDCMHEGALWPYQRVSACSRGLCQDVRVFICVIIYVAWYAVDLFVFVGVSRLEATHKQRDLWFEESCAFADCWCIGMWRSTC